MTAARERETSDELMLRGEPDGGGARADADLVVDRAQMSADGAAAEEELFGDFGIGQSLSHQPQHLDLARN